MSSDIVGFTKISGRVSSASMVRFTRLSWLLNFLPINGHNRHAQGYAASGTPESAKGVLALATTADLCQVRTPAEDSRRATQPRWPV